jgi:hypothetical protein
MLYKPSNTNDLIGVKVICVDNTYVDKYIKIGEICTIYRVSDCGGTCIVYVFKNSTRQDGFWLKTFDRFEGFDYNNLDVSAFSKHLLAAIAKEK